MKNNFFNSESTILDTVSCSVTLITNCYNGCYAIFTLKFFVDVYVFIFHKISCLSPFGFHFGVHNAVAKISKSHLLKDILSAFITPSFCLISINDHYNYTGTCKSNSPLVCFGKTAPSSPWSPHSKVSIPHTTSYHSR
jgi:hypothetical protein